MGYIKARDYETDIHIYTQEAGQEISLLQLPLGTKKTLSKMETVETNKQVVAKINCSYFNGSQVLGRQQGELFNGTLDQHDSLVHYDYVITKTGEHFIGIFNSWDYQTNVKIGFTPAVVLIKDGIDVTLISTEISDMGKYTTKAPQTLFGVTTKGTMFMIVAEGRNTGDAGLTGVQCRQFVKDSIGMVKHCVMLDSGGSSEMVVDNKVVNYCSDGSERTMCNGLAFLKIKEADMLKLVVRKQSLVLRKELTFIKRSVKDLCPFTNAYHTTTRYVASGAILKGSDGKNKVFNVGESVEVIELLPGLQLDSWQWFRVKHKDKEYFCQYDSMAYSIEKI